ncbi:aminotransferase class I/II-fold pyridoxal phosphate-dependent enzyme [Pontibacter sp. E15-1]|uniref:aminotransferase class I/II-fold pyridoxal phosphate-dependent enzyme n=1 Tax=Pontibacter sp. E15-1 TaxID=2919918 RepID=UPI001F4FAB52|nr:aminotransferase class I/II-fold pyridoxal phosphate-dependent enzyme [Pontibacter sp. E15-1]MCJ8166190.1 aminotransferase class I/II-fold pyridoxal phosphate-dependent enzyme [Pontibacter sp. E15-1]
MDDFTSALYLGLRHATTAIQPWQHLTTGVPAALYEPASHRHLASELARMQGLEKGVLAPSSLHLFWDVLGKLTKNTLVLADEKVYQITRWGLERAACRGVTVAYFAHHSPAGLVQQLQQHGPFRHLVVITDGWCPHCGRAAPLPAYLALARKHHGLLLLDDTQALGVLGDRPTRQCPYGAGGGGLLKWYGLRGQDIITVCSLAKGFGVPIAVLAGSTNRVNDFLKRSDTRVHCSPASAAHVQAALHALSVNRNKGDKLRRKLLQRVQLFKQLLAAQGLQTLGGFFPVQTLASTGGMAPQLLHQKLRERGIRALLLEPHAATGTPVLAFCLSAAHTLSQLKRVAACLSQILHPSHQKESTYGFYTYTNAVRKPVQAGMA